MGSTLYQVFPDVLRDDSIPSSAWPQRCSESRLHRSPLSFGVLRILYPLARNRPKLQIVIFPPKLGAVSMGESFISVPILGTSNLGVLNMGISKMGKPIVDVPIISVFTIGDIYPLWVHLL